MWNPFRKKTPHERASSRVPGFRFGRGTGETEEDPIVVEACDLERALRAFRDTVLRDNPDLLSAMGGDESRALMEVIHMKYLTERFGKRKVQWQLGNRSPANSAVFRQEVLLRDTTQETIYFDYSAIKREKARELPADLARRLRQTFGEFLENKVCPERRDAEGTGSTIAQSDVEDVLPRTFPSTSWEELTSAEQDLLRAIFGGSGGGDRKTAEDDAGVGQHAPGIPNEIGAWVLFVAPGAHAERSVEASRVRFLESLRPRLRSLTPGNRTGLDQLAAGHGHTIDDALTGPGYDFGKLIEFLGAKVVGRHSQMGTGSSEGVIFDCYTVKTAGRTYTVHVRMDDPMSSAMRGVLFRALAGEEHGKEAGIAGHTEEPVTVNAENVDAWIEKAESFESLGRKEEAVAAYDRALAIDPENSSAWVGRGFALRDLGRWEEAIAAYDRVLAIVPEDVGVWISKAQALGNLNRVEEEIEAYDRALAIDPQDEDTWNAKGGSLQYEGFPEAAIAACDRALSRDPHDSLAWHNKGLALEGMGLLEDAIAAYSRALTIDPHDVMARIHKYEALQSLDWIQKEAVESYERALVLNPQDADAWFCKGVALVRLEHNEEAIAAYDRALAIEPRNVVAWVNKGDALVSLNRMKEAVEAYDRALALAPRHVEARRRKASALQRLGS